MKRFTALLLTVCLLFGLFPGVANGAVAEEEKVLSLNEEDYAIADLMWEQVIEAETNLHAKRISANTHTETLISVVEESPYYLEDSLIRNGDFFSWETTDGIACAYSPYMRNTLREAKTPENCDAFQTTEIVSFAKKGSNADAKDVYVIQPFYGIDSNFTDQYSEEGKAIAKATGGTCTIYRADDANIDNITHAMENGDVVIIHTHGGTDYVNFLDEDDYVSRANTSYFALTTDIGLTNDAFEVVRGSFGSYRHAAYGGDGMWLVDGTVIANHMNKEAPNSFLWTSACLSMATEGIFAPLRNKGVEAVYGYSQSVTFRYDYMWGASFWAEMLKGKTVASSIATMKEEIGYWDYYEECNGNILKAQILYCAFPIVVSGEDDYPGKGNVDNLQEVRSTWRLCEHDNVAINYSKSPTCTSTGLTEGAYCSDCGAVLVAQEIIPAKGHRAPCVPATSSTGTLRKTSCITCGEKLEYAPHDAQAHPDIQLIHSYEYIPMDRMHMEKCTVCGEDGATTEHRYDEGSIVVEPLCGTDGMTVYTCVDCGNVRREGISFADEHDYELLQHVAGASSYRCKVCGIYYLFIPSATGDAPEEVFLFSKEHIPELTPAIFGTCTTTGMSAGCYCATCGKVLYAPVSTPADGHIGVTDRGVAPTCHATGLSEGSHCKNCGKVLEEQKVLQKTKHRAYCVALSGNGPTILKTSCTFCGKQLEYVHLDEEATPDLELIHSYKYTPNGSIHLETCTVCGKTGRSSSHNYNSGKITTVATCVTNGVMTYTCLDCGGKKTETLSYGDHTWEPVEETENSKTYRCKHCGAHEVYIDIIMENPKPIITIRPNEHTPAIAPAVPATCTSTGLSDGCYCRVCGEILVAQKTTPMTLHTPVEDAAVAPTCTSTGLTEGTHCSVCNVVLLVQESVPVIDHVEARDPMVIPTCTKDGLTVGTHCFLCGEVLVVQQVVPAVGHRYTNGVCICGEVQEPLLDEAIKIQHSLNLTSELAINFTIPTSSLEQYDDYYMECVSQVSGNSFTLLPVLKGNYYYFTLDSLTAFMMNDKYDATLHMTKDGTPFISKMDSYSVADYAYAQLNSKNSNDKLKRLCADILQYGAAAQTWKNYRPDALATDAMTDEHKGYLTDPTGVTFTNNYKVLSDIENPQISIARKTLSVENKIVVRYVVNTANYAGNPDQLSMRVTYQGVDGTEKTVILDECEIYIAGTNYYVFDLEALLAAELRSVITAAVYEGNTQLSTSMQYSVDTYGVNATGTVRELCQAMLAYSDSAFAYFSKSN